MDVERMPSSTADGSGQRAVGQPNSAILQRWRHHMQQFFCRIYASMRIEELFSIIRGKRILRERVHSDLNKCEQAGNMSEVPSVLPVCLIELGHVF